MLFPVLPFRDYSYLVISRTGNHPPILLRSFPLLLLFHPENFRITGYMVDFINWLNKNENCHKIQKE